MITGIEYLFLSNLAYCNFDKKDVGNTLKKILYGTQNEENRKRILTNKNNIINRDNFKVAYEFFEDCIEHWSVLDIEDQTAGNSSGFKRVSGFFAMAFIKGEEVVISYRGSETGSLEDAYRDFIENDLLLSFGKRPPQFDEGYKFYIKLVKNGFNPVNIRLTGHSLGGGIAQYVAVMSQKDGSIVPNTCTWNSVGIQRDGLIGIEEFIDFESILHEKLGLKIRHSKHLSKIKSVYFIFLTKSLKKRKYLSDKNILPGTTSGFNLQLSDSEKLEFEKLTKIDGSSQILRKLKINTDTFAKDLIRILFDEEMIYSALLSLSKILSSFRENKIYEDIVLNFVHSKDLTTALFKHIGTVYVVDQDFSKTDKTSNKFFKSFSLFSKSFKNYHLSDIFLPFIVTEGPESGKLSKKINDDYVVSSIRKLLRLEQLCSKELLLTYYRLDRLNLDNFDSVKLLLLNSFQRMNDEIKFKEQVVREIASADFYALQKLWLKALLKLPSPYESKDIYDYLLFEI